MKLGKTHCIYKSENMHTNLRTLKILVNREYYEYTFSKTTIVMLKASFKAITMYLEANNNVL